MKPVTFSPRTFFIAVTTAFVALVVVGWSLWSFAALRYRSVVDAWVEENRAAGYQISYDDRETFGFPRHIVMRLKGVRWKDVNGVDFRAEKLDIAATPWLWTRFDIRFKGNASLAASLGQGERTALLSAQSGRATVEVSPEGLWLSAKLTLDDARTGVGPNYIYRAERLEAAATRPATAPKDHTQPGLNLTAKAEKISLPDVMPQPFGAKADEATVALKIMGAMPDPRDRQQVAAWNDQSGIIEFETLNLTWGDLVLTAKGTVGFDQDLQPQGAFAGTIANPDKTMDVLKAHGFVDARDAGMLASAMKLFAKPVSRSDKGGMEFPVTLQLGGLFFGPVRICTFPEIDWPEPAKR